MFDEPGRGDAGPWQCLRCGIRLAAPLIFCPECGANQLAALSPAAARGGFAPDATPSRGIADRSRTYGVASAVPSGSAPQYGGHGFPAFDYDPIDEERELHRSRLPLYAGGAAAVLAFVLAAYVIAPRSEWTPAPSVQVIEGSVTDRQDASPDLEAMPSASRDAMPAEADTASRRELPAPADADTAGHSVAAQQSLPEGPATMPKSDANARIGVTRQLAAARANLNRNSLWPARRALTKALSGQPGNGDALQMRADLASRERERDALLGYARQCARSGQWLCVRQYAGRAASVDTSSREARRLYARAASNPGEGIAQRSNPDLLERLHRWFEQSIAQAQTKPARQSSPWTHP